MKYFLIFFLKKNFIRELVELIRLSEEAEREKKGIFNTEKEDVARSVRKFPAKLDAFALFERLSSQPINGKISSTICLMDGMDHNNFFLFFLFSFSFFLFFLILFKGVIEQVRTGSTYKVLIYEENNKDRKFYTILVKLAGAQSPNITYSANPEEIVAEPFAREAKAFVEYRILHRDVQLRLKSVIIHDLKNLSFP
jgi:hypothetical protein